jgi:hypothetical protein
VKDNGDRNRPYSPDDPGIVLPGGEIVPFRSILLDVKDMQMWLSENDAIKTEDVRLEDLLQANDLLGARQFFYTGYGGWKDESEKSTINSIGDYLSDEEEPVSETLGRFWVHELTREG